MERSYWIRRMHAAIDMARRAATAETRLIHFEMAGRYSLKAGKCLPPFMLPREEPATTGEREALRLPTPKEDRERGSSFRNRPHRPGDRWADGARGGPR